MGLPGNSVLSSTKEDHHNKLLVTCYLLLFTIVYADDSNSFFIGKNVATLIDIMNKELSKVIEWLHSNKLSLNVNKTQYMIFSNKNNSINMHRSVTINNIILKKREKY